MACRKQRTIYSSFKNRKTQLKDICIDDVINPYNFSLLILSEQEDLIAWLQENRLLLYECKCEKCHLMCTTAVRSRESEGFTLRCANKHEVSIKKNSMFSRSHTLIRDTLVFVRSFMLKSSLRVCAQQAGIEYKSTAVGKAKRIRWLFKQYVIQDVTNAQSPMKFTGVVEIDESLFGRKIKAHRGNPRGGDRIWILGLIERHSNRLILYPVEDRSSKTLISIITKHVEKGTRIFTDGWASYKTLGKIGYEHFVVNHSHTFKAIYTNESTGEVVECHTNKIEGAWQHAKHHFR